VWVKYSSSGLWEFIGSTPTYIGAGDMNGDGRDELLGTWEGQGVYYRNSETGAWTQMSSEATMITAGDLEGDGTDDLLGLWPTQGGIWVKYSSTGGWELLSSTAQYITAGKMRPAAGAPEAMAEVMGLPLPMGGTEPGPDASLRKTDESRTGPGGSRFVYLTEPNLVPSEKNGARLTRIPGPGEPQFAPEKQANLFPSIREKELERDGAKEQPRKKGE
ncbi:MAG: Repeat domain in Vibrio, Colwellia, Bradyrhizobium and Shewanella, partial [Candidatus Aminicenantes bacterium]|nr:Repeat domain in Vibrio, Colwellia, Bradyrhizobium and Shewanella [Candidatus Aminicenantes bacterium]